MEWATKEGLFTAQVPKEKHTIPEHGDVWIYGLNAGQKDDYEDTVVRFQGKTREIKLANARAVLLQMTVHNQHGQPLFGKADIGRINQLPAIIVDPILDKARRLSGMATGEIEELVKNSEAVQSENSASG